MAQHASGKKGRGTSITEYASCSILADQVEEDMRVAKKHLQLLKTKYDPFSKQDGLEQAERKIAELKRDLASLDSESDELKRQCQDLESKMRLQSRMLADRFHLNCKKGLTEEELTSSYEMLWADAYQLASDMKTAFEEPYRFGHLKVGRKSKEDRMSRVIQLLCEYFGDVLVRKCSFMEVEFCRNERALRKALDLAIHGKQSQAEEAEEELSRKGASPALREILIHVTGDKHETMMREKEGAPEDSLGCVTDCISQLAIEDDDKEEFGSFLYDSVDSNFKQLHLLHHKMAEFSWSWLCWANHASLAFPKGREGLLNPRLYQPLTDDDCFSTEWAHRSVRVVWPALMNRNGVVLCRGRVSAAA